MIEDFLKYLKYELNRSELTVKGYGDDLRAFEEYFHDTDKGLTWKDIDSDIIRNWVESMIDKGNSARSVCRRLSSLRTFYRWALSRNIVDKDPAYNIKGPKRTKPLPQYLRETEINSLVDDCEWKDDYTDTRARTIIILLYETGMRLAELIGLNDNDIDWEAMQLKVTGKRDKQRIIPFGDELAQELQRYIKRRDGDVARKSEALFLTKSGERMNRNQVRYDVKKNLSRVSTLKKRTPHVLRHTFATAMLNHDAGLESVKKLLGHESLTTTEIYTHTTFEQLKKVYKEAHPRA